MKKNKPTDNNTKRVIDAIALVVADTGCRPQDVSVRQVRDLVSDYCLKMVGGLNKVRNAHFPETEKDLKAITKMSSTISYTNKLEKKLGQKLVLEEDFQKALENLPAIKIKSFKSSKKAKIERALNIVLSDLHIGSDIHKEETGNLDFGKVEESRRLARITQEVLEYKPQYRNETKLNVLILGDVIQNQLHDPSDGAPLAEQTSRAIYLLTQSLAQMAASFPQVEVHFATGNHGRNTGRHHGRAVNQKWDSIETIIYYALKNSLRNNKNIRFNLPLTPYVSYEVFNHKIFATHGDSVLAPGYPGKMIKTGSLENQINRINASLLDNQEYSVFIVGHVHTGSITHLSNGAVMITNGPMVPVDEFAVSIGLLEGACGQYLFESVKGFPVGDSRFIRVSEKDDKNPELDKIIKPWIDFNEKN